MNRVPGRLPREPAIVSWAQGPKLRSSRLPKEARASACTYRPTWARAAGRRPPAGSPPLPSLARSGCTRGAGGGRGRPRASPRWRRRRGRWEAGWWPAGPMTLWAKCWPGRTRWCCRHHPPSTVRPAQGSAELARAADVVHLGAWGDLVHPGLGLVVLLVITGLNVYKPRGLTRYGWRKQQEQRRKQHQQRTAPAR
jgi:hypothetical protein